MHSTPLVQWNEKRSLSYFSERWPPSLYTNSRKSMGRPNTWKIIFHSSDVPEHVVAQMVRALCYKTDGNFHWHNPSGRTMAVASIQPLKEMSNRDNSWVWRWPVPTADLTTFRCPLSWNLGTSKLLEPPGTVQACTGIALPYLQYQCVIKSLRLTDKKEYLPGQILWNVFHFRLY
jgi:hypothetical protein